MCVSVHVCMIAYTCYLINTIIHNKPNSGTNALYTEKWQKIYYVMLFYSVIVPCIILIFTATMQTEILSNTPEITYHKAHHF